MALPERIRRTARIGRAIGRLATGAAALSLAVPPALRAQDGATGLTLERALEIARARNPDLERAYNGTEAATASERRAWGAYLPRLSTDVSLFELSSRRMTAQNEFGQPVALNDPAVSSVTSASGGLNASITLFDGFGRLNELQAARAGARAADALVEAERVRVEAEVARRFYDALGAAGLTEVEERLLASAEERLSATRAMVQAGRATPQDVLGAEVDLARQRVALENARADAYNRELLLREVMGVGTAMEFRVAGVLPELIDPAGLDTETLVGVALGSNPRLRRATAAAAQAENVADAARAARWPRISVSGGLDRGISLASADQLTAFPWNRGSAIGVSVSLPLFTGFALSEQIAWAAVAHADAEAELRATRLAVEREVLSALTNVRSAYATAQLARRAAELAVLRHEMGQEGFRHGLVSFTELQQLTDQASQAERTAVRTHMDYARALATLEQAVGQPVDLP